MVKPRSGLSFEMKSLKYDESLQPSFGQNFDGRFATHHDVFGQVDAAHSTCAEVVQQFVFPKKESLVLAAEQLVAMPPRNQIRADEIIRDRIHIGRESLTELLLAIQQVCFSSSSSTNLLRWTNSMKFLTVGFAMPHNKDALFRRAFQTRGNCF